MKKLRWGILSTAGIGRKNWRAIRDSGNNLVTAVASRDLERARKFIAECQKAAPAESVPAALGSYEELIASPNVDAVYVPLPTGLRKEWILRAAAAGKHVLCEKPCAVSLADLREMTDACQKKGVQFMDGVMFMHSPRMGRMRDLLDDGKTVGQVRRIMSSFTFAAVDNFYDANIRVHAEMEPMGCLGDLGWYCLRFALWAMKWQLPQEVTGRTLSERGNLFSPGTSPTDFSGELTFGDGGSMGFFSSFRAQHQDWAHIGGATGWMRVDDFVHPASVHMPSFVVNGKEERVKACDCTGTHTESRAPAHDSQMFRNFAQQVASGKLNTAWPMWSLKTQQVMDACFQSAKEGGRSVTV
jgi:predicted dehydrogenase